MIIQGFLIVIILLIIIGLFLRLKQKQLNLLSFIAWLFFWLVAAFIIIYPETANFLARILGIGRGADVIIYFSIIIIFYFIFYFTIKLRKIDREITELVRKISFMDKK